MAITEISKEDIKKTKEALRASLKDEEIPQRYTTKELVSIYYKEICELVRRFNLDHAVKILEGQDIKISANTLKQYLSEFRQEIKKKEAARKDNIGTKAKTNNKRPTQDPVIEQTSKDMKDEPVVDTPVGAESDTQADSEDRTTVESTTDTQADSESRIADETVSDTQNNSESRSKGRTIVSQLSGEMIDDDDIMNEFNFV